MTFDRRQILWGTAGLTAGALAGCKDDKPAPDSKKTPKPDPKDTAPAGETATLKTLAAAAARVLPSEGEGPGAKEAGIAAYFDHVLKDADLSHVWPVLRRAATFLDGAVAKGGAKSFADAPTSAQDNVLNALAQGKMRPNNFSGPQFMRVLVALTLEGFLADPKYGGNKDRVAWNWLNYDPAGRGAAAGGHHE